MEQRRRQRRKTKLAKLHKQFTVAKTQDVRERIILKAEATSPTVVKSEFLARWS